MTDKPPDIFALWRAMLPGSSSTVDHVGRTQAASAAEALRRLNAPLEDVLRRHREFETAMADAAAQLTALADQLDTMARTYAQLNRNLELTVAPYLGYVEQLERYASGDR